MSEEIEYNQDRKYIIKLVNRTKESASNLCIFGVFIFFKSCIASLCISLFLSDQTKRIPHSLSENLLILSCLYIVWLFVNIPSFYYSLKTINLINKILKINEEENLDEEIVAKSRGLKKQVIQAFIAHFFPAIATVFDIYVGLYLTSSYKKLNLSKTLEVPKGFYSSDVLLKKRTQAIYDAKDLIKNLKIVCCFSGLIWSLSVFFSYQIQKNGEFNFFKKTIFGKLLLIFCAIVLVVGIVKSLRVSRLINKLSDMEGEFEEGDEINEIFEKCHRAKSSIIFINWAYFRPTFITILLGGSIFIYFFWLSRIKYLKKVKYLKADM